ncbi:MAG: NAD-dependent epimerase/dehydratase family protein [Verrucomicrobiia bacterium]
MPSAPTSLKAWTNPVVADDMRHLQAQLPEVARFEGTTLLVTGAAGFLGYYISHFLCHLADQGVRLKSVLLLDKFVLGRPAWIDQLAAAYPQVAVHSFDIATDRLETVPGALAADYVLHMASIASPTFYRKYPLVTLDANVWGLRNLLDAYRDTKLKGLLFFSSSEIYGDPAPEAVPTNEEYRGNVSCTGPRSCYDEAKRFGETLCWVFANTLGTPVRVVRPFNNYGPGMALADRRAPADFARCVLNGQDIVILSSGTPSRTFCYVADAVAGYFKALLHDQFEAFNIGIERPEISVRQLAEHFRQAGEKLTGYRGKVVFQASPEKDYLTHNPERRCPDITRARTKLNYQPSIYVEAGVERFLKYLWHEQQNPALR